MRGLMWFREDLRIHDNTALYHAAQKCESIIGVYIIDTSLWNKNETASSRIDFILRGLDALSSDLQKRNIPLLILTVNHTELIAKELFKVIEKHGINAFFFNHQYEVYEARRDQIVSGFLTSKKNKIFCLR